jgi:hypothetical protein
MSVMQDTVSLLPYFIVCGTEFTVMLCIVLNEVSR